MDITRREILAAAGAVATLPVPGAQAASAPFTLPPLPYAADALEPHIDARTMEIHHGKHHQAYVDNLNRAVADRPEIAGMTAERLLSGLPSLPEAIRTAVRNNAGGHANHSLFWRSLAPAGKGGSPAGGLQSAITRSFGGQDRLEDQLRSAAMGVFGSGWAWLSLDESNRLVVHTTPNQDHPVLAGRRALLGLDVWEHAYYLKYQNRRADYLAALLQVVHWGAVSERYAETVR